MKLFIALCVFTTTVLGQLEKKKLVPGVYDHMAHGYRLQEVTTDHVDRKSSNTIFAFNITDDSAIFELQLNEDRYAPDRLAMNTVTQCQIVATSIMTGVSSATALSSLVSSDFEAGYSQEVDLSLGIPVGEGELGVSTTMRTAAQYGRSSYVSTFLTATTSEHKQVSKLEFNLRRYGFEWKSAPTVEDLDPDFVEEVDKLDQELSKTRLDSFMNKYGTHYYHEAAFGATLRSLLLFDSTESAEKISQVTQRVEGKGFDIFGISANGSTATREQIEELIGIASSATRSVVVVHGGANFETQSSFCNTILLQPIPVKGGLRPVWSLFEIAGASAETARAFQVYASNKILGNLRNAESSINECVWRDCPAGSTCTGAGCAITADGQFIVLEDQRQASPMRLVNQVAFPAAPTSFRINKEGFKNKGYYVELEGPGLETVRDKLRNERVCFSATEHIPSRARAVSQFSGKIRGIQLNNHRAPFDSELGCSRWNGLTVRDLQPLENGDHIAYNISPEKCCGHCNSLPGCVAALHSPGDGSGKCTPMAGYGSVRRSTRSGRTLFLPRRQRTHRIQNSTILGGIHRIQRAGSLSPTGCSNRCEEVLGCAAAVRNGDGSSATCDLYAHLAGTLPMFLPFGPYPEVYRTVDSYLSSGVRCRDGVERDLWGCHDHDDPERIYIRFVRGNSRSDADVMYPTADDPRYFGGQGIPEVIPGVDIDRARILLLGEYDIDAGEVFYLYYGDVFRDYALHDNAGEQCADIDFLPAGQQVLPFEPNVQTFVEVSQSGDNIDIVTLDSALLPPGDYKLNLYVGNDDRTSIPSISSIKFSNPADDLPLEVFPFTVRNDASINATITSMNFSSGHGSLSVSYTVPILDLSVCASLVVVPVGAPESFEDVIQLPRVNVGDPTVPFPFLGAHARLGGGQECGDLEQEAFQVNPIEISELYLPIGSYDYEVRLYHVQSEDQAALATLFPERPEFRRALLAVDGFIERCPEFGGVLGQHNGTDVCCAASCGTCGGFGCSRRPGGAAACCVGTVIPNAPICAEGVSAPCVLTA